MGDLTRGCLYGILIELILIVIVIGVVVIVWS
jgi:hypothetical protein